MLEGPQLRLAHRAIWRREIPYPRTIPVVPGDAVRSETVVAEGNQPAEPIFVPLDGASPMVQAGSRVRAGEPVARRKRLLNRVDVIQAPATGVILRALDGGLLLQPQPLTVRLEALLPGRVAAVHPTAGVDVEGSYGLLRGAAGSGGPVRGRLGEDIAIVVEPLTVERAQALARQGVRAAVVGSLTAGTRTDQLPLAWLATEPAAGRQMAAPLAGALERHLGRLAALQFGLRAWLGFELGEAEQPSNRSAGPESWVRTAHGEAGRLTDRPPERRIFPSGLPALAAEVDLGDRTVAVPFDSLEWLA